MGGNVAIPYPAGYGVPPPTQVNVQGSGGMPSPGAGLLSGIAAGQNIAGTAIANYRGRQQYEQDQAAQKKNAYAAYVNKGGDPKSPGAPQNPDATQAHSDFISSLGESLKHAGSAISGFFGQPSGNPGAAAPQAIPSPPQSQVPQNGPNGQGSPAQFENGGPVPGAKPLPFLATPVPGAMGVNTSHQALPGVSGYAAGGPVQSGAPDPGAAAAVAGAGAGEQVAGTAIDASRGATQYNNAQGAQSAVAGAVEAVAQHLHDGALDDQGVPNGKQGVPAQPGAAGALQAADNPAAQKGVPENRPAGPHSLTPDYWDKSDQLMAQAAAAAATAGHDPNQVYQGLESMRTSFIQSHILRNLSSANVALANGDMKAVETSLRNVNYYLPNGQDITIKKDASGNLIYQDPLHPTSPDGKPNLIPVDAQHLQMLGQAALDPMQVASTLQAYRASAAEIGYKQAHGQAELETAEGTKARGQGIYMEGAARLKEVASTNVKNLSAAQLDQARAAAAQYAQQRWMLRAAQLKLDPTALKGAQQAAQGVEDVAMGKTAIPIKDDQGNLNINPRAGQMGFDPSKAPKEYQNINPLELAEAKALAGDIYISNARTGMTSQAASTFALQFHAAKGKTHKGAGGKNDPDAYVHREAGEAGVWNPATKKYDKVKIGSQSASGLLDNGGKMPEDAFISAALGNTAPASGIPAQQPSAAGGQDFPGDNGASDAGSPAS